MATEVATLTFKADTADLDRAEKALDGVTQSGKRAEKSTDGFTNARKRQKTSTDAATQADNTNTAAVKQNITATDTAARSMGATRRVAG